MPRPPETGSADATAALADALDARRSPPSGEDQPSSGRELVDAVAHLGQRAGITAAWSGSARAAQLVLATPDTRLSGLARTSVRVVR